ncbi:MAG TPA: hypothetical protein VEK14_00145 [Rhodomicrobium sp.]|nr:hypothetical protein [Rhodomicrobium sp.]
MDYLSERELVRAAALDPCAREQLRLRVGLYVERKITELIDEGRIPQGFEAELIEVGTNPFDVVFNIYLKNARYIDEKEEGHFLDYYTWWMRQAVFAHLEAKKNPGEHKDI